MQVSEAIAAQLLTLNPEEQLKDGHYNLGNNEVSSDRSNLVLQHFQAGFPSINDDNWKLVELIRRSHGGRRGQHIIPPSFSQFSWGFHS